MAPPNGSQTGDPKARAWSSGCSRQVGDLAGLPPLREAEVRESTGHRLCCTDRPLGGEDWTVYQGPRS